MTVYDLMGRVVKELPFGYAQGTRIKNEELIIDMRGEEPGVYFVKVDFGERSVVKKVVLIGNK